MDEKLKDAILTLANYCEAVGDCKGCQIDQIIRCSHAAGVLASVPAVWGYAVERMEGAAHEATAAQRQPERI